MSPQFDAVWDYEKKDWTTPIAVGMEIQFIKRRAQNSNTPGIDLLTPGFQFPGDIVYVMEVKAIKKAEVPMMDVVATPALEAGTTE